jgi:hypothetical protein
MPRGFIKYKAYPFVDKDPVIDVLRTAKRDKGMKDIEIENAGGPKASTCRGWFTGNTKRPQFATVAAAAIAMGLTNLPLTSEGRQKLKRK